MLQIAVCDPSRTHRAAFCAALERLFFDTTEYAFSCFSSGEELLSVRTGGAFFQLVFLEIHLGGSLSGLETAARLRCLFPETDLIFLTDAAEYLTEGYRYHAFDFLVKPVSLARLQDVVGRYLEERRQRPADFLNVRIQRCTVQLPLAQIYYLESQRRKIVAHMWESNVEFYDRLDHLEELLAPSGFLRCHQSYLLNPRYIRQLNGTCAVLADGSRLPVSRNCFRKLKDPACPQGRFAE